MAVVERTSVLDLASLKDAPEQAIVWLLKGGLSPEEAETTHGIKWHEPTHRLMLPIRDRDQRETGLLSRSVNGERPKYRMVRGKPTIHFPHKPSHRIIVAVEDVLSSIAVAKAGYDSVAVLGTSISDTDALAITRGVDTVLAFMDPDKAGRLGAVALRKKLALYPVRFAKLTADRDPKYLSRLAIREIVDAQIRRNNAGPDTAQDT